MPHANLDMLTRKKLLTRKYNNSVFSNEQLEFFPKFNASEITTLLKENPHLRECSIFFQHLSIRQVEKIIASVFQPEDQFVRSQLFNILVNVLRNTTRLLEMCFKQAQFNYMSLFGFLEEQHVDYPVLILFEDVLLPFIRKSPAQVLDVIVNDQYVEEIILRRLYEKPIFKIMYTVIFCLSKRHSETHKDKVNKIIHELVQTPFTYLLHKEKFQQQKINIIAMDKTQLKGETIKLDDKPQLQGSSKNIMKIHNKKVKQKRYKNQQQALESVLEPKLKPKFSLNLNCNQFQAQSQIQQSMGVKNRLRPQLSLQINQPLQFTIPQQKRSRSSIHLQKSVIFNENLDYSDLTHNMKELLSDLTFNLKSVDLSNLLTLLDQINESYINGLVKNCERFLKNDEYEGYCEGAVGVLIEFAELYKSAINLLRASQDVKNSHSEAGTNSQSDGLLIIVVKKLQKQLSTIAGKIPLLCNYILQDNQTHGCFSSGQRLKKIGMAKYRLLQLIVMLLQFNSKSPPRIQPQPINLPIAYSHFDLFLIIQKYLSSLKWNNLIHCQLLKLARLSLQQDYPNFKKRYIEHLQKPKDGILGTLMQIFRNKKFVFLKNMQFTNNGNLHVVYEITKTIVQVVKQHHDYNELVGKFPAFDEFVTKDLSLYEKLIQPSQLQVPEDITPSTDLIKNIEEKQQFGEKQLNTTLQGTEEMIHQIENAKRWVPSLPHRHRPIQLKPCI